MKSMSMKSMSMLFASSSLMLSTLSASAQTPVSSSAAPLETVKHLQGDQVIEFRRYVTKEGELAHFVKYFDTYFPEAFEQLGAMVFGQFTERGHPNHFTWLRGFKELSNRPIIEAAFYYGPVWKEHHLKVNAILPDSDNVMLMRPLHPDQSLLVLPAVDPVTEEHGAGGIVVAQIFSVKKGSEEAFAAQAEKSFAGYRMAGLRSAGVLVTLDVTNNFPQLPIRTDGPFLVWLGVIKDEKALKQLTLQMSGVETVLNASGLLRNAPEHVIMDPTPRSRLRWLDDTTGTP